MMSNILTHLSFYFIGVCIGAYINDKIWHASVTEAIDEFIEEVFNGKE